MPSPNSETYTIAFYNTENLLDYRDNPSVINGLIKTASHKWTKKRYEKKIYNTGLAISKIGFEELQKPPALIGLAEVENDRVLNDLIKSTHLRDYNYGFVRYDSPDERGINVALLYDKSRFKVESSKNMMLNVESEAGVRDYTRDILKVSGHLDGEKIHLFINHWPSRHEESDSTGHKRMHAAQKMVSLMDAILEVEKDAKIIVMGDFNDNPKNESIQYLKNTKSLYNPMEELMSYTRGSASHNFKWMLFDQIMLTRNFLDQDQEGLKFLKVDIFNEKFLAENRGKYKGQPFRTYIGKKYKGGFSDHFPVYIQLKKYDHLDNS